MRDLVKGLAALRELTPRVMDAIASYGERLSTAILTQVLENNGMPAQLMDARQCIVTDDNFTRAGVLFDLADPAIVEHLRPVSRPARSRFSRASSAEPAAEAPPRSEEADPITAQPLSELHWTSKIFRSGPMWTGS